VSQTNDEVEKENGGRFGQGFPPESIAIVGISRNGRSKVPGYDGLRLFQGLRDYGYAGRLYPVNPKADEILGEKAYASVVDIPERLDLAIVTVPAPAVPRVIDDCAAAGVRYVHVCSSGFGETGLAEGLRLEEELREKALKGGVRIIGPNCMGFNVPSKRITTFPDIGVLPEGGVGLISQSGGHARLFMMNAASMGLGLSAAISYGNGLMLDAVDFIEYLAEDDRTQVICVYLEGIRDGRRLAETVRRIVPKKPVIIWKGGLTDAGSRAAASHTGSMAGSEAIWRAFYRQTGAVRVDTLEEMAEAAMAFQMLRPLPGARAAVMTMGGGSTVQSGDLCGRANLAVPRFSPETQKEIPKFVSSVNQGLSNPMDVPGVLMDPIAFTRLLRVVAQDPNIDVLLVGLPVEAALGGFGQTTQALVDFNRESPHGKQVAAAITDNWGPHEIEKQCREAREMGVPLFPTFTGACLALNRVAGYYRFLGRRDIRA